MSRVRHSTPYDRLAIAAGRAAGMADPTPDSVSSNDAAREARDALWLQYEMRLTDSRTHTLDNVLAWLMTQGVKVGRTAVFRDRKHILARENAVTLAAAKARAVIDAVSEHAEGDIFAGGRLMAAQLVFNALSDLGPEALTNMTVSQVLKMVDTLSKLSTSHAQAEMIAARLAEMRKQFDDAAEKARAKAPGGTLSAEDIAEIRRATFGEAA